MREIAYTETPLLDNDAIQYLVDVYAILADKSIKENDLLTYFKAKLMEISYKNLQFHIKNENAPWIGCKPHFYKIELTDSIETIISMYNQLAFPSGIARA